MVAEVSSAFRSPLLRDVVPQCSDDRWRLGVPTLYLTIKSKCWRKGKNTCSRVGLCCLRRIASWMQAAFATHGEGMEVGIGLARPRRGDGLHVHLNRGLKARCKALHASGSRVCGRCSE